MQKDRIIRFKGGCCCQASNFDRNKNVSSKLIKKGFTLAEVLITLVIVGVVSALTIPSVVIKYQKEEAVTKLKKSYSVLQQVLIQSELENGPHKNWDYTLNSEQFFNKYLKKYFLTIKGSTQTSEDFSNTEYYYHKNGTRITQSDHPIRSAGFPKIILNDGTIFSIKTSSVNSHVTFDINGPKKPNVYGNDVFYYLIKPEYNMVIPLGYELDRSVIIKDSTWGCKRDSFAGGQYCAALIMKDGWKISDDYPWSEI